jgi:two-component system, NarL family, nitrate/nitrite response regulator NarL
VPGASEQEAHPLCSGREDARGGVKERPRVLIASDVRLYREGLAVLLRATDRVEVVGVAEGDALSSGLTCLSPDIALLDVELLNRRECAGALATNQTVKVIAVAVSESLDDIVGCAIAGASGFVGKDGSAEDIVAAIEGALRGELPCPPRIAGMLFQHLGRLTRSQMLRSETRHFTSRELEVIKLVNEGRSNKEIARQLSIGPHTVKNHVHNILEKLNVHRRGEAMAALRDCLHRDAREGLVSSGTGS